MGLVGVELLECSRAGAVWVGFGEFEGGEVGWHPQLSVLLGSPLRQPVACGRVGVWA